MTWRSTILVATAFFVASGCSQSVDTSSQEADQAERTVVNAPSTETSTRSQSSSTTTSTTMIVTESSGVVSPEVRSPITENTIFPGTISPENEELKQSGDSPELIIAEIPPTTTSTVITSTENSLPPEEEALTQVEFEEETDLPVSEPEYQATIELTAEMVASVDMAIDLCGEMPNFQCSKAVLNICDQARSQMKKNQQPEDQNQTDEQKAINEAKTILCLAADLASVYEIGNVLSAKYNKEYYIWNSDFVAFRNLPISGTDIILPEFGNEIDNLLLKRVFLMSESTIRILQPLTKAISGFYGSTIYSINNQSDETISTILGLYSAEPENTFCLSSALVFLNGQNNIESEIEECIRKMCSNTDTIIDSICSPTQTIVYVPGHGLQTTILEDADLSKIEIYWRMLPFICANGVTSNFGYPEDACRKMAVIVYNKLKNYNSYLSTTRLEKIKSYAVALGSHLVALPRVEARRDCYNAISEARKALRDALETNDACSHEQQVCEAGGKSQIYEEECEILNRYYNLEILWKSLPLICHDIDDKSIDFFDTTCYSSIDSACTFSIPGAANSSSGLPKDYQDRYYYEIGLAPCYISTPENFRISRLPNSDSRIVKISSIARPEVIRPEPIYSNLTFENLNSITMARDACETAVLDTIKSECSAALWTSCYDLKSLTTEDEHPESEVSLVINYLCSAAYIAELAELAAVLFSSFESTYNDGGFDEYRKFIASEITSASEITRKSAFAPIESDGIQLSQELTESLSNNVLSLLKSVNNSLGGFVMPYLLIENDLAVDEISA